MGFFISNWWLLALAVIFELMAAFQTWLPVRLQKIRWEWLGFACWFATFFHGTVGGSVR